tara:strand:+ start:114 stop:296 length:183 start_codon:yes stop_codon:yes gene_type:complete
MQIKYSNIKIVNDEFPKDIFSEVGLNQKKRSALKLDCGIIHNSFDWISTFSISNKFHKQP